MDNTMVQQWGISLWTMCANSTEFSLQLWSYCTQRTACWRTHAKMLHPYSCSTQIRFPVVEKLSIYFLIFSPFYFFLSFIGFTYFLLLSIPSLSTRIVPLRFQAGGRRRRPNLGLVTFFCACNLCYLYSLVKMHCGVFWFTFVCSFSALTLLVGSFDP